MFGVIVAALMVPPIFTLLPNFVLVKHVGALNTFAGLVLPSLLMTPFAVFFLRQFFLSIPRDVEEAATLEGIGKWGMFWRIVLPMSRGPLITIGLTTIVWSWKDYLWPLLVGKAEETRVLTVGLGVFLQQSPNRAPDWTGLMAGSVLSVHPGPAAAPVPRPAAGSVAQLLRHEVALDLRVQRRDLVGDAAAPQATGVAR